MSILIVEDSDNDYFFVERAIRALPAALTYKRVLNGKEAIEYVSVASQSLPKLILMDIKMPVMDGYTCLSELKKMSHVTGIPVILFSTLASSKDRKKSFEKCAFGHIEKPKDLKTYEKIFKGIFEYWFKLNDLEK